MPCLKFDELGGRVGLHHIAVTRLRPRQKTQLHSHDFFEIFLVESGEGIHEWNGEALSIGRGSLVFINPSDTHRYIGVRDRTLQFVNLAVPRSWWRSFRATLSPVVELMDEFRGSPRGHVKLNPMATRECGEALHDLIERGSLQPLLLPRAMNVCVSYLLKPVTNWTLTVDVPDWLSFWTRDFNDPEMLARPILFWQKHAGVSPEHLARSCRRYYGESPTVLLNRARIQWIQTRLRQGEDKVAVLALDAGFQNLGFFYRCFKRFAGVTPKEWVKNHAARVTVPR